MAYKRLGELLIAAGMINEDQLNKAIELQKDTKDRLGTVLINNGFITETHLIEALQMQLGIEYVDLSKTKIPATMAQTVPKNIAKQYSVVPVRIVKDELYLAMSDPLNFYAIEEVRKSTRKKVVPMVATASGVEYAIQVLYGNEGAARAIEDMQREAAASNDNQDTVSEAFVTNQLDDAVINAPTIRLVNSIIERAINERASDIHIEPRENEMQVRMRIDGMLRNILPVPKELQSSVISRLKVMADLDISERRIPQDGRFNVQLKGKSMDVRVSTLPTVFGEKVVCRLLDKSGGLVSKESIGFDGDTLEMYKKMINIRNGVILIAGPTGSGKSTTMYSMINELNTENVNLVTLEDPVEYNIDGINQVQINEKTGMTFAGGLRSILRQDPDIIAVGEIRDGETADIAMRAAITGHVVISTIHTNDSVGTIERLKDLGLENYLITSALKGVISQRLVRKICPHCKSEYEPSKDEMERLGITPEPGTKFYKGQGCAYCFNSGYQGRTGIFEMLYINKEIQACLNHNGGRSEVEEILAKPESNFTSLRASAIKKILSGETTVDEIMRVVSEVE